MGTHPRVLSESYLMNTNMTGFRRLSEIFVLWTKAALAVEGLIDNVLQFHLGPNYLSKGQIYNLEPGPVYLIIKYIVPARTYKFIPQGLREEGI